MDFETYVFAEKKQCPFCAETILEKAIKCRYCGEFLNTTKTAPAQQTALQNSDLTQLEENEDQQTSKQESENIVFVTTPSLFGMAGTILRGMFLIAFAIFLINYPFENLTNKTTLQNGSASQSSTEINKSPVNSQVIQHYRRLSGFILFALVMLRLLIKTINLKCIHYEVTPERIEFSRGILDRKVDNIDMFRIVDLSLRRSMLDCIFGIGSVTIVTNDKTDPKFQFLKVRHSRELYDLIKTSSLKADKRNSVIHIEN